MVVQLRSAATISKGFKLPSKNQVSATVCMSNELFNQIREAAIRDGRSFSNMVSVLAKRGLKVVDVSK